MLKIKKRFCKSNEFDFDLIENKDLNVKMEM
jgi:hypothetical protein